MNEYISEFIALLTFVVIVAMIGYSSDTDKAGKFFSWMTLFGLVIYIWWIVKFVILGVLIK